MEFYCVLIKTTLSRESYSTRFLQNQDRAHLDHKMNLVTQNIGTK